MKRALVGVVVIGVVVALLVSRRCATTTVAVRDAPLHATKIVTPQIVLADAGFVAHVRAKTDVELSGTVQDITGGPIAGAVVECQMQRTLSDAAGAFSLWMKAGERIDVRAVADGYAATTASVTVPNHIQLLLTPEATIDGTVVDDRGPVAGALVEARAVDLHASAVTDGEGAFHLANLSPARYVVTARTPHALGQAHASIGLALAERVTGVVIHLDAAVRITGRISDCKEPSATLHALGERFSEVPFVVAADGLLQLEGVRDGRYTVEAECPHAASHAFPITVAGKDLGPLAWKLAPEEEPIELDDDSAIVHGVVTDATGKPFATNVSASGEQNAAGTATTGAGTYSMKVKPGTYDISVGHDGWHPLSDEKHVTLAPHQDLELSFTVPISTGVIRGDVKDATGKPVADAFVEAWIPTPFDDFRFAYDLQPVVTDKDGAFVIEHLQQGTYNVEADRRGGGTARANGVALGTTVHLVVPALGSIAGTVSYRDGKSPDWFILKLRDRAQGFYREEETYHSHGAFVVDDLPAGDYSIIVASDDASGTQSISLAAGEIKKDLSVTVVEKPTIRGRLVDDKGAPIEGWKLVASSQGAGSTVDWGDTSNNTDANGVFAIRSPAGAVELQINAPGDPHAMPCHLVKSLDVQGSALDLGALTIGKPCTLRVSR